MTDFSAPASASSFGSASLPSAGVVRPANLAALWTLLQDRSDAATAAAVQCDDGRPAMRHLGQMLVAHGLVSPEQVQAALLQQQQLQSRGQARRQLGQLLVEAGALSAEQLRSEISAWLGQHIIDPSLLTPDSKEMTEDLLTAALNDTRARADQAAHAEMQKMTAGLPLPPGFKL